MPLYSKKDFSELCKVPPKDLYNYIKRGKVIIENDLINSDDIINAAFLSNRKQINDLKQAKSTVIEDIPEKKDIKKREPQTKFEFPPETKRTLEENFIAEGKIKNLVLEKTQNEIELQKFKILKQQGDVIPTSLVKSLIAEHSKSMTISFRDGVDNFLIKISGKAGFDQQEIAAFRGELIDMVNTCVNNSIDNSKKMITYIIEEYSKQKGVGERE